MSRLAFSIASASAAVLFIGCNDHTADEHIEKIKEFVQTLKEINARKHERQECNAVSKEYMDWSVGDFKGQKGGDKKKQKFKNLEKEYYELMKACKKNAKPDPKVVKVLKVMHDGIQNFHKLIDEPHSFDDCDKVRNELNAEIKEIGAMESDFSEDENRQFSKKSAELKSLVEACKSI